MPEATGSCPCLSFTHAHATAQGCHYTRCH